MNIEIRRGALVRFRFFQYRWTVDAVEVGGDTLAADIGLAYGRAEAYRQQTESVKELQKLYPQARIVYPDA